MYQKTGVFVGVERFIEVSPLFSATGGSLSITSGRLSYTLGLVGPCYSVDTACSSTLAALHTGAVAIRCRECEDNVTIGTRMLSEQGN